MRKVRRKENHTQGGSLIVKTDLVKLIAGIAILIAIQYFSARKMYITSSLIAEIPLFTMFAYSISYQPKETSLYLALFALVISITMFLVYFIAGSNKIAGLIILITVWLILSAVLIKILGGGKL